MNHIHFDPQLTGLTHMRPSTREVYPISASMSDKIDAAMRRFPAPEDQERRNRAIEEIRIDEQEYRLAISG